MKPSYYALIALVLSLSTSSRAERQPTLIFDAEERKFSWYDGGGKRHKAIDNGVYNTVIFEAHQSIDVRIHNARFGSLYRVQVLDNPVEEVGAIRGLEEAVPLLRLAFPTDLVLPEIKGGLHLRPGLSDSLRAMLERLDSLQDVEDLKLEIAREADRLTKDIDALAARIDAYRRKTERLSGLDGRASTNPLGELRAAMDALRAEISAELRPAESMYENEKAFVEFVQRSNRLIREVNSVEQHIKTATTAFTGSIQTQSDKLRLDLADMRARLIAYRLKVDRMQATVPLVEGLLEYRTGLKVEADLIERGIEHLRDSLDIETIEVLKASLDVKAAEAALKAEIEKSKLEKAPKNEAEIDAARKVLGQAKAKLAPRTAEEERLKKKIELQRVRLAEVEEKSSAINGTAISVPILELYKDLKADFGELSETDLLRHITSDHQVFRKEVEVDDIDTALDSLDSAYFDGFRHKAEIQEGVVQILEEGLHVVNDTLDHRRIRVRAALDSLLNSLFELHKKSSIDHNVTTVGPWDDHRQLDVVVYTQETFSRPDRGSSQEVGLSAGFGRVAETEPSDFEFVARQPVQIHRTYRYSFTGGLFLGNLKRRSFDLEPSNTNADVMVLREKEGDSKKLDYTLAFTIFPCGKLDSYPGSSPQIGLTAAVPLNDPTKGFYTGVGIEIPAGLQIVGGAHFGRRKRPAEGITLDQPLPTVPRKLTVNRWETGGFVGISLRLDLFTRLLGRAVENPPPGDDPPENGVDPDDPDDPDTPGVGAEVPDAAPAGGGGNLPTVSNEVNVELSVTNELVSGSGERSAKSELEKEISVVEQPAGTGSTGAAEGSDAGASTGTPDNAGEKEPGAGEEEAPKPETEDAGASSTE